MTITVAHIPANASHRQRRERKTPFRLVPATTARQTKKALLRSSGTSSSLNSGCAPLRIRKIAKTAQRPNEMAAADPNTMALMTASGRTDSGSHGGPAEQGLIDRDRLL